MSEAPDLTERTYDLIAGETDEHTCEDIPDRACTDVPRNFLLNAANGVSTKLAQQLASPSLVLPWLLSTIGAPAWLSGWLMPVKQAGSLLPQMVVAGYVRSFQRRKWFWVGAGFTQAIMLLAMALLVAWAPPLVAGVGLVVLLGLFSVASGVGSVAFSDVVGKTIPKGRRGRLLAARATAGGVLALGAGLVLRFVVTDTAALWPYLVLLLIAASLWAGAAVLFGLIQESPGATEGGGDAWRNVAEGLEKLREDRALRGFVLARALLLGVELAAPFYALFGRELTGGGASNLGVFVIATAAAKILSAPIWGRFADRAAQWVMCGGGIVGALAGGTALVVGTLEHGAVSPWAYAPVFLLIGFAEAGVRLGRKTYITDAAPPELKGTYKAVTNTIIGAVTLFGGGLGFVADYLGAQVLIGLLMGLCALAAVASARLPNVERA